MIFKFSKYLIVLWIFVCIFFSLGVANEPSSSIQHHLSVKVQTHFQEQVETKSPEDAQQYLRILQSLLSQHQRTIASEHQRILLLFLEAIDTQLQELDRQQTIGTTMGATDIYDIPNADIKKIKQTRLQWYNQQRKQHNLTEYSYHPLLDETAQERAEVLKQRYEGTSPNFGTVHKRDLTDTYYDYHKISQWMADRGVLPPNKGGRTFTETVGYGIVSCDGARRDCTDEIIEGISSTFDFYMSEQPTGGSHYNAMISPYYKYIGLGLTIQDGNYWIVVHYATDV